MAEPILNSSPNAGLVTARHDIDGFSDADGNAVFSVNAGIPLGHAFDQLTILLATAHEAVETAASATEGSSWTPAHLLNFAYGLTQAMHEGLLRGPSHE